MKRILIFLILGIGLFSLFVQRESYFSCSPKKINEKKGGPCFVASVSRVSAAGEPLRNSLATLGQFRSPSDSLNQKHYGDYAKGTNTNIFSSKTNKLLPEPQASLLNGILWGEQKAMPKDFYEALRRTGMLHAIALSGMNITILIDLLGKITLTFGRKKSIILSTISIIVFVWFVGASASVVRAAIMGSMALIATYFGKKSWALLSLLLAGGIMLIFNPGWLTNIGFQLSFLATLGIILLGGKVISDLPAGRQGKGVIGEIKYGVKTNLRTTLAAQVFTLPVILYNFKQLSLIAPLTNVLVLWVVQYIMVLGFVLSAMSLVFSPLAYPLAWIIWVPLTFFIKIVELTAKIPLATVNF